MDPKYLACDGDIDCDFGLVPHVEVMHGQSELTAGNLPAHLIYLTESLATCYLNGINVRAGRMSLVPTR